MRVSTGRNKSTLKFQPGTYVFRMFDGTDLWKVRQPSSSITRGYYVKSKSRLFKNKLLSERLKESLDTV